jgi:hypothetical protein
MEPIPSISASPVPIAAPIMTSRPTIGSRMRPINTLDQEISVCGHCRQTEGSSAI